MIIYRFLSDRKHILCLNYVYLICNKQQLYICTPKGCSKLVFILLIFKDILKFISQSLCY